MADTTDILGLRITSRDGSDARDEFPTVFGE